MISLDQVSKHYAGNRRVLHNISLTFSERQFVCLLGPSGCGKTTLLNLVAGFVSPSAGRILVQGRPVCRPGPDRGVVFQDSVLFPWMTALENVCFGLKQQGMNKKQAVSVAEEYLELVGMNGYGGDLPVNLSGGMRQRVAIARILALRPDVLLMDEPFSALDANSRERLQEELLRICEAQPVTVLYVTHNVDEASFLAERVLIMGVAPQNIHADIQLSTNRPRGRYSPEFIKDTLRLRGELDRLPCCLAPVF